MILVGVGISVYPFVSVWRLQQQVLDEVPLPNGTAPIIEGKPDRVLFDDDFVLAFRGVGASVVDVERTLLDAGFEATSIELEGSPTFARECCGSYDAVLVSVFEGRDGVTGLRYSVTDSDIVATWYFITGFGLLIALAGVVTAVSSRVPKSTARVRSGHTPISTS